MKKLLFLLLPSPLANALDLQCDKVEITAMNDGEEIAGTYSENWTRFMNLIPDQNQTYMDGDTKVTIQWSNASVTIEHELLQFERDSGWSYTDWYRISRKDFTWKGYNSYKGHTLFKGLCKIWEKPSDNAF